MVKAVLAALFMMFACAALPAAALSDEIGEADAVEFQRIISGQIAAFNADNGPAAYAFAAPMIQRMFPTPDIFMTMVKQGYQPVYRQKSYAFSRILTDSLGRPNQHVTIVDINGKTWTAVYSMEKQPDGSWKISGCVLIEAPSADA